ncbi:hypothetical protein H671_3g10560 [Cricetulus griseus]|nr:hypothetical protein H671_3g10560 [Cricetulus griseus]
MEFSGCLGTKSTLRYNQFMPYISRLSICRQYEILVYSSISLQCNSEKVACFESGKRLMESFSSMLSWILRVKKTEPFWLCVL